jgi:phenylalanyl-tRNA synthetase beta chain
VKLSWRWLARHVDLSGLTPAQVADDLTLSVAEVEGVEPFAAVLKDVVVGRVVTRERHPDADKLSLCTVDIGPGTQLRIVCGAPNVRAGQKVAVATVGTTLPGDFKIKRSRIRGVDSQGMICSERELGLGEEHDGIWELDPAAEVGKPVAAALAFEDWTIEIDNKSITHRPDLWGHRGMAAELSALYRRPLKPLDLALPPTGKAAPVPVRIESPACARYLALAIDGARAERSPEWLRHLLLAAGQRPIDVLVDLSNFVMLDLGQPNHLFDRERLASEGIVVRMARAGERLTTLDGAERQLATSDLLICSGPQPVALAGVMGGEGSKVEGSTSRLLLEAAAFDAPTVRRTSARLGLRTDASTRFEKCLDPHLPLAAAAHFVRLLQGLQPQVALPSPPTDVGAWKDPARSIALRPERVRSLLGVDVSDDAIADILGRLGFGVARHATSLDVRVPAPRATKDITVEQDLIEEVGRIWRYGNVPEAALVDQLAPPARDEGWERRMLVRQVEDRLAGGARFHQTLSYSFVADRLLAALGLGGAPHLEVENPVAEGLVRVRRSVVPSLLGGLEPARRLRADVRLFEVGKGYLPEHANERGEPRELHELGLVWAGARPADNARFDAGRSPRLQGVVEDVAHSLGLEPLEWRACAAEQRPAWAHPARAVAAWFPGGEAPAAVVAPLDPALERALGLEGELKSEVAVASVSIDALLAAPRKALRYRPLPTHPGVKIDVALSLPAEVPAASVRSAIEKAGKGLVAQVELFDVFSGGQLGAGRRSLAWHVLLQAPDRTLAEGDSQKFLTRLEREVQGLGGELRRESR